MRKSITPLKETTVTQSAEWLDLSSIAAVEISSENPWRPIENALCQAASSGWQASGVGTQTIRICFDHPISIRRVEILFSEAEAECTQEFTLGWSDAEGSPCREIVRQQFTFSPSGAVSELEDYRVEIHGVRVLELEIIPDQGRGAVRATLERLRVAGNIEAAG